MKKASIFLILFLLASFPFLTFTKNVEQFKKLKKSKVLKYRKVKYDKTQILDISKIRRGMRGYGLTVFSGVKPQRFRVEIIGVLKNEGPKSSLILAKFKGGPLKKTGVIAGMSGSPVYIKGKLIGAVSHAFPWTTEPIGAIRPIKEMLEVLNKPRQMETDKPIHFIPLETSLRKEMEKHDGDYYRKYKSTERVAYVMNRRITLRPILTPILFSGIDDRILNIMRPEMEAHGFYPLKNGSGGQIKLPIKVSRQLNPGDAVGITLIAGDMSATPVGTVTYRRGNEVLIFGHPSFFRGSVDMPMSKEYIHTVIPNRQISFKLSSTLFEVGRIFEDRNTAVAGELNKFAKMIPVNVNIKNEGKLEKFKFRIVKDNVFFPNFLVASIMQSVFNVNSKAAHNSIKFKFTIKVKNLSNNEINTVTSHDLFSGNDSQKNMFQGIFRLTVPIEALLYNPFVKTEIISVTADLEITNGWNACELVEMQVLKNRIKPGDEVPVLITLKNYKGKQFYKKVFIKIPHEIRSRVLTLGAGSAKAELILDKALSAAKFSPRNYKHLINILNMNQRFNDLVVWIDLPDRGLIVDGKEHPNLPSSIFSIMRSGLETGTGNISGRLKKYFRSNYLIYGIQVLPIDIELDSLDNK
ncbi:MAG: hypothetical protein OEV44_11950 [Spirochaetota bacterium]|nr:hypothetical protein [Spirochaetota bacterium]